MLANLHYLLLQYEHHVVLELVKQGHTEADAKVLSVLLFVWNYMSLQCCHVVWCQALLLSCATSGNEQFFVAIDRPRC